jgi:3-oxoacyl-[acyl-carrier protein] reductase
VDLQLAGRKALVTGGSKGIGRAVVESLAGEGATVAFCARGAEGVEACAAELTAAGHDVRGSAVDVSDGDALRSWVTGCAEELGGIDVVVANVSALAIPPTEENWEASFRTDMLGTVRLVEAALPSLEASGAGSIVTISSVSGREIDFAAGPYGTFKGAIVHYTQGLAHQLAGRVRANSVSPGNTYFEGGVWESIESGDPELYERALGLNPTGRMARPEEIAVAVTFLASPVASFVTGTNLVVDGALTRGVQL